MLVKEFEWKKESRMDGEDVIFTAHTDAGRFTVLDRLTGWGDGCCRDIETGFKDKDGKFWLASGMFDIRSFPELQLSEAVDMVKKEANTCIGV
jgi:hypothetical protein